NLFNVWLDITITGILAIGMTFVIITAGIDLSVASNLALTAMVGALMMHQTGSVLLSFLLMLAVGFGIGAFNGILISKLRMVPFIVTLGMLSLARGLAMLTTRGRSVYDFPPIVTKIGSGEIYGIPVAGLITVGLYLIAWYLLNRTVFGRSVFLVGSNPRAARLSGINVESIKSSVYVLSGLCGALAGFIQIGRLNAAKPSMAYGLELDVVSAVVLGGTSLFGGKGSIIGTLCGAFIIVLIRNAMVLFEVSVYYHQVVKGIVIFIAVFIDVVRSGALFKKEA
ncbi:MAG: ABC transporter permease, partial [Candidatus Atribacteria bacterium]|nr:ABC transporter permease [Candidatus Atribacteria bacterium]MCD6350061.1 ABC transporter permease [Candidatus Atribacteria bacterium]